MNISANAMAERLLPSKAAASLRPLLKKLDNMISGSSDDDVSRRVAMIAFSIRVISAAIAYVSQVLLARWMGEFQYGIFIAVWVGVVILGGLACMGFQSASIRFISEYRQKKQAEHLRGIIIASISYSFIASSIIACMGMFALYFAADLVTNYYVMPLFLAAVCLPLLALSEVQDGVARAYSWPMVALAPTFLARPILILVVMFVAILMGYEPTAITAMGSTIVAAFISTAFQLVSLLWRLRKVIEPGPATFMPKTWTLVALPIFLIEGFYNLLTNTDILFVSWYLTPENVAVYFAAVKTLALVHFVYFAVKAATAHRFSTLHAAGDVELYESYIAKTIRWVFWPSLILGMLMALTGKYFLMLFGPEFANHYPLIWILVLGIVIRSTVGPAETILTMSGEQNACARIFGLAFLANIVLNATLIPAFGLEGAAIATTLAMGIESILLYTAARKRLGLQVFIITFKRNTRATGRKGDNLANLDNPSTAK